jgi:sorbitol-specific phosphotransferase system component IIA
MSTEKDVTIPGTFTDDGITYKVIAIDDAVFKNNTSLANLTISENVRTIGKYAFQGCSSLKKIELPSTLMGIGEKAFDGCKNITHICCKMMEPFGFLSNVFSSYTASLYVPEGQENSYKSTSYWNQFSTIVEGYFVNEVTQDNMTFDLMTTGSGSSLKATATLTKSATTSSTVTIPSKITFGNQDYKVTKIGPSSFSGNSKIINLTIPEHVQTIGENAFNGCNNIVNIISKIAKPTAIPDNVFSISSASLYVPQGTRDKYMSLGGWSRFTTVYEGVMGEKTVGDLSFVYATADKTALLVGTTTTAVDVVVPDSFAVDNTYYYVTAIDKSVFKGKTSIVNLTLPSTLKQIGDNAFDGCKNIATIVSKATEPITMSDNAFSSYTATLYVPKDSRSKYQTATGWNNFATILEGVWKEVTLNGMTFLCATGDKTATLIKTTSTEKDVTILGTFTDDGITYKVTAIDDAVFKNNTSLVNLKISENVKTIGAYAFQGCSDLRRLELPSTLMYIEEKAFDGAKKLSHVCCKAKVAYDIDENVFSAYTAALYVPDGSLGTYQAKSGWNKFTNIYQGYFVDEMVSDNMTFVCLQNGEGETITTTAILTKSSTTTANVSIPSSLSLNNVLYKVTTIGRSAFSNNSKLVNLTISENITTIEDNAFNGCMNIAVISSLIKEPSDFSENVFSAYTATLYVPVNTRSKYQAAKGWKNFGTILEGERNETTTEDGMTYIYATGDKTATLVKAAVSDKDLVISGTFKLGDVTYTVTAIDNSVFKGNKSIVNLKIAENIKTIGTNAFQNCVNLQKVELPSTLTGIGENAFGGCTRLSHIVSRIKVPFPINDNVFAESIYPTAKLYVPTVTSADYKNTTGWKNFTHILVGEMKEVTIDDLTYYCVQGPNIATLVKASTAAADVTIPATVKDGDVTYQVTEIGAYAFSGIGSLVKVTISEGITTIGIGAFQNCSKLERVVLPSTWTSIGDYAFDKCTRLSLVISNNKNPIWINDNVFSAYTAKVNVPVGTTDLYRNAGGWGNFQIFLEGDMKEVSAGDITYLCVAGTRTAILTKCSSKSKEITVPTSISDEGVDYAVVTIDESAFANNSNLVNLTISDGVKTIRNKAFSNCSYLNKVILPSTLTGIGDYAFEKCNRLSNIGCYIQKPLTISENVFTESTISNATLCVPDKTKSLYASADVWKDFNFIIEGEMQETVVDGMTYICVPNQKWAKLIKGNSKAKEATVPGSITVDNISYRVDEIDRYAFASFASLESVTLSDGIQIIGETAFQNCYKLKKVVIPSSVTVFGSKAFEKCSKLQEVYYYREEPVALSDDVFPLSEVTLYVLISSVGKYQAAETWNQFKSIIGLETITVSSAGQLTYASAFDLDFSEKTDLKAYVATGYDKKTGTIWLTRVKDVAAGTGILLMGEAGKYDIPVMHGGSTSYYMNLFRGTLEAMTLQATDGANTNYYLSNGDAGVGFYKVTKEGGVSLAAHRAYLSVPTDIPAVGSAGGTETIKVSSAGQVPYYNSQSLDFGTLASQGVRAYTATGYNYSSGTIWLTRVMQVPAETGILIMAPEGSYDVPTASVATVYANMFKGTLEGTTIQTHETIAGEDYINYYLSNGDAGVGFYKVTKEGGVLLNANRCYLPILNKDTAAGTRGESSEKSQVTLEEADEVISIPLLRGIGGDEDGTTSIRNLTPALSEGEGEWYTLQGQRVTNPGKGLYIHNGKKVVIK